MKTSAFAAGAVPIQFTGNWPTRPRCAPIWWQRRPGGTEEGRAIMAIAESRPAVPAVLHDMDEAAEALRLSGLSSMS